MVTAIGHYIALKKIERVKSTLILPAPVQTSSAVLAEVVSVGPMVPDNYGIHQGDVVWVSAGGGIRWEDGGEAHWVVDYARNDIFEVVR